MSKLPKGWIIRSLGGKDGIATVINGSTPSTDEPRYWDGDILWATPSDLGKFREIYLADTERKITIDGLNSCSTNLVPAGTVIMTSRAPVGNLAIAGKELCTNQGFKNFVLKEGTSSEYLYFYLKHLVPQIQKDSHGNTFTEITKTQVEKIKICIPEKLEDQIAIARDLQSQFAHVEAMRQAALKQKEAAKALQFAILREVFSSSDSLSSLPIKKTGKIITGYTPPRGELENYGGLTPWIKPEDLDQSLFVSKSKEYISKNGLKTTRLLPINSVLVSCIGNIGKMAIAEAPLVTNQQINSVIPNDDIDPLFLYFAIKFALQNKKDINIALVSILNAGDFGKVIIPYIHGKEKQKIFAENVGVTLRQTEAAIKSIEKEIEAIEALPAAILREAFHFEKTEN